MAIRVCVAGVSGWSADVKWDAADYAVDQGQDEPDDE
jgi:hypothetical protein